MLEGALDRAVERVEPVQRQRFGEREPPLRGGIRSVMGQYTVRERESARVVEPGLQRMLVDDAQAELDVTEHPALVADRDLSAQGQLTRATEVVDKRRAEQQILVEPRMQRAGLDCERPDGDGVLEQPTEVGVVTAARGGPAPQCRAQRVVAEDTAQQRAVARLADLAGQVLEKTVEFLDVAVCNRQERRRVDVLSGSARDAQQFGL